MSSKDENKKLKEVNEKLKEEKENENEDDDDIMKILIRSNEYDEETNQNKNKNKIMKKLNDHLDEIIDKSKSFEDQIESLEKVENLEEYYFINDFDDKELRSKIFKLKLSHLSNIIDKKLFEQILGHTLIKLADKLINTTNKEENQIIVRNIENKRR